MLYEPQKLSGSSLPSKDVGIKSTLGKRRKISNISVLHLYNDELFIIIIYVYIYKIIKQLLLHFFVMLGCEIRVSQAQPADCSKL